MIKDEQFKKYEDKYVKARPISGPGVPRSVEGECVVTVAKALSDDTPLAYIYTVDGFSVVPSTIKPTIDPATVKKGEKLKDPRGGLTAAGRAHFNRQGSNLKPGVKGAADTPEKMRRKGSFLTRFFTNPSGPMQNDKGEPTRLALSAAAWGEPVPKNRSDAAKLAAKGRRLLERYEKSKKK